MKRTLLVAAIIFGLIVIYLIVGAFTSPSPLEQTPTAPPGVTGPAFPPSQTAPTTPPPGFTQESEFNPAQESSGPTEPPPAPLYP